MGSHSIQTTSLRIDLNTVNDSFRAADANGNGSLYDAGDALPHLSTSDGKDKLVLINPDLALAYRRFTADSSGYTTATIETTGVSRDPDKLAIFPREIYWLVKQNGGHLLTLGDLAWLYPNAKLAGKGLRLCDLARETLVTEGFPRGISFDKLWVDPSGELIASPYYAPELSARAPEFAQLMTNRQGFQATDACKDPDKAFTDSSCAPDSWPLPIEAMLSAATLRLPLSGEALISRLNTEAQTINSPLAGLVSQTNDGAIALTLGGEPQAEEIYTWLTTTYNPAIVKLLSHFEDQASLSASDRLFAVLSLLLDPRALTREGDTWVLRPANSPAMQLAAAKSTLTASDHPWLSALTTNGHLDVDLRDATKLADILTYLNDTNPAFACDPNSPEAMSHLLGSPVTSETLNGDTRVDILRKALLVLLDHPLLSLAYDPALANDPAACNRLAKRPTLYATARISPEDPSRIIFAYSHIDMQSYKPRGTVYDTIMAPGTDKFAYQHQGESEPMYFQLRRDPKSAALKFEYLHLGDHFVAPPLSQHELASKLGPHMAAEVANGQAHVQISVAYGSGGRELLPEALAFVPGPMMQSGSQSGSVAWFLSRNVGKRLLSTTGIFPFIEVYPGESNLSSDEASFQNSPNQAYAQLYKPDTDYDLKIEGQNGDLIPTATIYSNNGATGSEGLNLAGYPFIRGVAKAGNTPEHSRMWTRHSDYLHNQRNYADAALMGHLRRLSFSGTYMLSSDPTIGPMKLGFSYDEPGILYLGDAFPLFADLHFAYNPIAEDGPRFGPQFSQNLRQRADGTFDTQIRYDLATLEIGILHHFQEDLYGKATVRLETSGGIQLTSGLGASLFFYTEAGALFTLRKGPWDLGLGIRHTSYTYKSIPQYNTSGWETTLELGHTLRF